MNKWLYELLYRLPFVPMSWIFGSHSELLEELLESKRIAPGRAIDLGCGDGSNAAIFLAKNGFEVIGVDFLPVALKRARKNAQAAGVEAKFIEDDLTNLRHVSGTFDLLVDFGALNDLKPEARDLYMRNVLPLIHPGSLYILMCFEKNLGSEEIERRFGEYFNIETIIRKSESVFGREMVFYLMNGRQS